MTICLDENAGKVSRWNAELAQSLDPTKLAEKAASRGNALKEIADSGDADFTRLQVAEGRFIDLAMHKDTFLDDAAITTGLDVETPPVWKTRYAPTVGLSTGSVYGRGFSTLYVTQDNYASLVPFVVDVEDVRVPKMALTQDPEKLGQRQAALLRQAEALKINQETFLVNFLTEQPLGTDLATSVTNFITAGSPYNGKTIYVVDPGVQAGTYETSNIIDVHTEGGLTGQVAEAVINQSMLSKRQPRTIHIPVAGLPWRTLMRQATVVALASTGTPIIPNANLRSIPTSQWEDLWNQNFESGIVLSWFGHTLKFKANNALPQGFGIITTDQPGAEIFNVMSASVSTDYTSDPRDQYFENHYEKREIAIAVPDPWRRNVWFLSFGNTVLSG